MLTKIINERKTRSYIILLTHLSDPLIGVLDLTRKGLLNMIVCVFRINCSKLKRKQRV
jgi:hypothetical protein